MENQPTKKELDITTPAGLRDFLRYGQEQYQELLDFSTGSPASFIEVGKATRAYNDFKNHVELCIEKDSIGDPDVVKLQSLYDKLIEIIDDLSVESKEDTQQRFTGNLAVENDSGVEAVPITVNLKIDPAKLAAPAAIHNKIDPRPPVRLVETAPLSPLYVLINNLLKKEDLDEVIDWFGSVADFENYLRTQIKEIESLDRLDRSLKITYASPFFDFLMKMKVSAVEGFSSQPNHEIKKQLDELNINDRACHEWLKYLENMKQLVSPDPSMTFGELYVLSEIALIKEHFFSGQ